MTPDDETCDAVDCQVKAELFDLDGTRFCESHAGPWHSWKPEATARWRSTLARLGLTEELIDGLAQSRELARARYGAKS